MCVVNTKAVTSHAVRASDGGTREKGKRGRSDDSEEVITSAAIEGEATSPKKKKAGTEASHC
jgi:hypothetical protein